MIRTRYHYDPNDPHSITTERIQDCAPVLRDTKILAENTRNGMTPGRTMRHVARIPLILVEAWMKEGINVFDKNHWPAVRKKLLDLDYRKLRVGGGDFKVVWR